MVDPFEIIVEGNKGFATKYWDCQARIDAVEMNLSHYVIQHLIEHLVPFMNSAEPIHQEVSYDSHWYMKWIKVN